MNFDDILKVMLRDKRVRLTIVKRIHKFFYYFYFAHRIEYPIAPFHEEIFHLSEQKDIKMMVIAGFRGCGKSELLAMSLPLWAILGDQKVKFIVIIAQTEEKAQMFLRQIKLELENNELLKRDLGPFQAEGGPWNTTSLYFKKYNAKITIASAEQSLRSFRHMQYRPQLIILDDLEDLESVKSVENRDKLYNWLIGDVIPAGTKNTRLVILGGILGEDSLLSRLQKNIRDRAMSGVYRAYPIVGEDNMPTWPGKYPDMKAIEEEKMRMGDEVAFQREHMLRIIGGGNQVIRKKWIRYYDKLPDDKPLDIITGVDLAISKKESANFTSMVSGKIYAFKKLSGKFHIYILPDPINERLDFPETIEKAKILSKKLGNGRATDLVIENSGYQEAAIQQLRSEGYPAISFKPMGSDKRSRLALTTDLIKNGMVLFPRTGVEPLANQLIGFGHEKYDDLADAFAIMVLGAIRNGYNNRPPIA